MDNAAAAKAEAEAIARAKVENNVTADMPGFGNAAVRDFSPGTTHRAESINAGQVTDRDGVVRVDTPGNKTHWANDTQISEMTGQWPERWAIGYPAWKEGAEVMDWVLI